MIIRGLLVAGLLTFSSSGGASTPICRIDYGAPLHNAVADRDIARVKQLVETDHDVNLVSTFSIPTTPLALAFRTLSTRCVLMGPDVEIISYLIQKGADVTHKSRGGWAEHDSYNALHRAAILGLATLLEPILKRGAALEERTSSGRTALLLALFERQHEATERLLQLGANPNARETDSNPFTPLHIAARYPGKGNRTVKMLLRYGAKYISTTKQAGGPFYHLSQFCQCEDNDIEELIDLLTLAGGSVNESYEWNWMRRDPLSEGVHSSHTTLRIIEALLRKGANPRWALFTLGERSNLGPTRLQILALLARYGAEPENTFDSRGVPLLEYLRTSAGPHHRPYVLELEQFVTNRRLMKGENPSNKLFQDGRSEAPSTPPRAAEQRR